MTHDVEGALRTWALLEGVDPDRAVADLRHGGPLAHLVRSLLSGSARPKRGRKRNVEENWRRFVLVVMAKRRLACENSGDEEDEFHLAAYFDQRKDWEGDRNITRPEMYAKTYRRMVKLGWCDDDVPQGLKAQFSTPPALSDE
ncbi:hypothetical protein [Methylobacterium cerastii]|uniref:hypothetical protein n=1 Tax=Methylobacterium cerastii TaxID=932741 RepID=UPI001EE2F312|nr:hypothetical protein [Methylobacterium cerastii]